MSRFLKVSIVLLAIAAMAAPVAFAADNLSLSGSMRVRGAYLDDGGDSTSTTVDHRLRVGGKFKATDNISLTFRTDFSEGGWGSDANYGRFGTIKDMDRAHLDIDTDSYHLRAGTQYIGLGNTYAFDTQDTGVKLDIKGAVPFSLFYILDDNNTLADKSNGADDYFVGASTKFGGFGVYAVLAKASANEDDLGTAYDDAVAAMDADDFAAFETALSDAFGGLDQEITLIGATYNADYDGIKVAAELDYFTGDAGYAGDDIDVSGLQGMLDVSMAASEAATVGARLWYAQGNDEDISVNFLGNGFGGYDAFNYGPFENENLTYVRPFEAFSYAGGLISQGVIALQGYGSFKASDATTFTGSIVYAEPEDDFIEDDDAMFLNAGMTYALMQNATIKSQVQYIDYDSADDAQFNVGLGLWVNF